MSSFSNHSGDELRNNLTFCETHEGLKRIVHVRRIVSPDGSYGFTNNTDVMLCDVKTQGKDIGVVNNVEQLNHILDNKCQITVDDASGLQTYFFCQDCIKLAHLSLLIT